MKLLGSAFQARVMKLKCCPNLEMGRLVPQQVGNRLSFQCVASGGPSMARTQFLERTAPRQRVLEISTLCLVVTPSPLQPHFSTEGLGGCNCGTHRLWLAPPGMEGDKTGGREGKATKCWRRHPPSTSDAAVRSEHTRTVGGQPASSKGRGLPPLPARPCGKQTPFPPTPALPAMDRRRPRRRG